MYYRNNYDTRKINIPSNNKMRRMYETENFESGKRSSYGAENTVQVGSLVNHDERCEEETVGCGLVERTKKIVKITTVAVPSC